MKVRPVTLMLILAAGPTLPACFHASAKAIAEPPPLSMPAPPPRVVEAVEVPPPAPIPLVEEPPRQPVLPPPRPTPRVEAAKPDTTKSDPPVEAPKAIEEPAKAAPAIQTTPATAEGEVERKIRGVIGRATADLNRVNYRALNADARNQWDTAKRFLQQAESELRTTRNLVFAGNLAEKAAALAVQLAGR